MVHGDVDYEMLQPINLVVEKKIKIEYIEKIRENKLLLKQHKYATLSHIENQLLNEARIDIKTFFSLCVLENINIFYINKKTYYELIMNDDMNTIFILQEPINSQNHKYGFESETQKTIEQYKKELFHIEHLEKPLKAISSYKLNELIDFCNRLGLETVHSETKKPKKKQELYEILIQYF
jgi:methylglyoxal synthase